jgi:hypothetical protein
MLNLSAQGDPWQKGPWRDLAAAVKYLFPDDAMWQQFCGDLTALLATERQHHAEEVETWKQVAYAQGDSSQKLAAQLVDLQARYETLKGALNQIASWSEGPTVNSSFDEPMSAQAARDALALLTATPAPEPETP